MTKNNRTVDTEHIKRISQKVGLRAYTPSRTVRPITISKTRTVKRDYAMLPREQV
jgi:hypothetical protein